MRTIGLYKKTENFRYQAERLDVIVINIELGLF